MKRPDHALDFSPEGSKVVFAPRGSLDRSATVTNVTVQVNEGEGVDEEKIPLPPY